MYGFVWPLLLRKALMASDYVWNVATGATAPMCSLLFDGQTKMDGSWIQDRDSIVVSHHSPHRKQLLKLSFLSRHPAISQSVAVRPDHSGSEELVETVSHFLCLQESDPIPRILANTIQYLKVRKTKRNETKRKCREERIT